MAVTLGRFVCERGVTLQVQPMPLTQEEAAHNAADAHVLGGDRLERHGTGRVQWAGRTAVGALCKTQQTSAFVVLAHTVRHTPRRQAGGRGGGGLWLFQAFATWPSSSAGRGRALLQVRVCGPAAARRAAGRAP
jgi:hypothetical protein